MDNYFLTRDGQQFKAQLLMALNKIGDQLERANDLKEKELKEKETK